MRSEPAFPTPGYQGMTLRDFFAVAALQSSQITDVIEAFRRNDYSGSQHHRIYVQSTAQELAEWAYSLADAMIAERDK